MFYLWICGLIKLPRSSAIAALALWCSLFAAGTAQAATYEVDAGVMGGSCCVFKTIDNIPGVGTNSATINVGDTIHWLWKTNFHSVSSDSGAWTDSGVKNSGFTFNVTFNTAGSFPYHCSVHGSAGSGMAGVIKVVSPGVTITGRLALEGVGDLSAIKAPLGKFHISLRTPATTAELFGYDVTPISAANNPNGTYTLTGVTPGTYDVAIKGLKNLRVVKSSLVFAGATGTVPDVLLPAGDANGDNSVDPSDFGIFVSAYNSDSSILGSGYDATADFNFDGMVDPTDFGLFVGNYNTVGAN